MKEIPVTQARADLSNLINEVVYNHERVVLTRHGRPLAVLISTEEAKLLDSIDTTAAHSLRLLDLSGSQPELERAARYDEARGGDEGVQPAR
ncbi:MAG TPA: type II toxin-antitoxin system Phd/YefM family antitoxin [Lacisediminihabitans sp.]|uniref:type II toxin-antitoxin system Phd/YefM family antitoxin n=1 Tax=Lacisediminihabitans sp. TaxID=2787631 RepID=UPI002EDB9710